MKKTQLNDYLKIGRSVVLLSIVLHLAMFSFAQNPIDTLSNITQSSLLFSDSLQIDTLRTDSLVFGSDIPMSESALDAPVDYKARDSMIYDIANQKIYLYGGAEVKFETITLQAGYIELDWGTNIVLAEGALDSLGQLAEKPNFKDKSQEFVAERMRYNFKTQKGIIYDVTTTQENLYVLGAKSKFVRTQKQITPDSIVEQDIIYSEDAIFTTCNHPEPHYGIRSSKQKVIPGKMVIVGPSNVEIAGIPTPLFLPFAFFPTTETRTQGLIIPRDYEYSEQWGFGVRNIGYYIPVNDYLDLTLNGNVYLKGTWGLGLSANFRKRYKYNGRFSVDYASQRTEGGDGLVTFMPSMAVRGSLNQASGAHPTRRIGGSVNIQFNNFQANNFNDAQSVLQGQFSSNFSYNQSFPGKPFTLSAAFTHSQSASSGRMTINFPNLNFQTQTIYPLKRKNRIKKDGTRLKEQWYEQIAFRYQGEARASVTGQDDLSQFFETENFQRGLNAGIRQRATLNTSFKLLKNLSVTPSVNYNNSINFKYSNYTFMDSIATVFDTIVNPSDSSDFFITERQLYFENLDQDTTWGVRPIHEYSASISLNTTLFRTVRFKKGWLRGIRHVVKPSVSMNYSPDYTNERFNYFFNYDIKNTIDSIFETRTAQIFNISQYRPPTSRQQMSLNYSITNIYEAKYFSKKDSTDKKFRLFDNIYITGNYNFVADSLNLSDTRVSGTTRLFQGITTFNFNANWSWYDVDENGRKIDRFYWRATGKPLRFNQANFQLSTNLTFRKIKELIEGNPVEQSGGNSGSNRNTQNRNNTDNTSLVDWLSNFSVSHQYTFRIQPILGTDRDTLITQTNSLSLRGRVQLTPNWQVNIGNIGYDFKNKGLSFPNIGFTRNLHCWQLSFNWSPTRNFYSMTIGVIDAPLNFLQVPYRRNQADGQFTGF